MKNGKFEKGDLVTLITDGMIGTVENTIYGTRMPVMVEFEQGNSRWFNHEDLALYEPKETSTDAQMFREITEKMADLYEKKNAAYGNAFSKSYAEFGKYAPIVRLNDKMERLKTLGLNSSIDNLGEAMEDTLMDMANYSIMFIMELKKNGQ